MKKFGFESAAQALKGLSPSAQERLLQNIAKTNLELASQLRDSLFGFEKISQIYGQDVYKLVDNVDKLKLLLTLRLVSDSIKNHIFSNLPSQKSKILKQELEEMSPQPRTKVEEAQSSISATIQRLAKNGTIRLIEENEEYV